MIIKLNVPGLSWDIRVNSPYETGTRSNRFSLKLFHMDKGLVVTDSIVIKAPVQKVWQALTDPVLVKQYFYGTTVKCDWQKGSPIRFTGEWDGRSYEEKGDILDIEKNKLISYSYLSSGLTDIPENYAIVTYLLIENQGQTTMRVKQAGFTDEAAMERSIEGWKMILSGLKKTAEEL